jgi:hypothetical protein
MKLAWLMIFSTLIAGCSNGYEEQSYPTLPDELKDCKVYYIHNKDGDNMKVMRCPNSTTSTHYVVHAGKNSVARNNVVVDGNAEQQ